MFLHGCSDRQDLVFCLFELKQAFKSVRKKTKIFQSFHQIGVTLYG